MINTEYVRSFQNDPERGPLVYYSKKDVEFIQSLYASGAHMLPCRGLHHHEKAKRPLNFPSWQKRKAKWSVLEKAIKTGNLIGLLPGRSNLVIMDQDEGDPQDLIDEMKLEDIPYATTPSITVKFPKDRLGRKFGTVKNEFGSSHFPFIKPGGVSTVRNSKWVVGKCHGEIRGDKGYVILWDIEAWKNIIEFQDHLQVFDLKRIRKERQKDKDKFEKEEEQDKDHDFNFDGQFYKIPRGSRNDETLKNFMFALEENDYLLLKRAWAVAQDSGLSYAETEATFKQAKKQIEESLKHRIIRKDAIGLQKAFRYLGLQWRCNSNVSSVYEFKGGPWYLTNRSEYRELDPDEWESIRHDIALKLFFKTKDARGNDKLTKAYFSKDVFGMSLHALMLRKRENPFKTYLENCKVSENPDAPLLGKWLEVLGVPSTGYTEWVSKQCFVSIIARALEPGVLIRTSPVLVGQTEIGKSAIVREMLPEQFQKYFTDDFSFKYDSKRMIEQIVGTLIVEISEMDGAAFINQTETMKGFLTRREDKYRIPYATAPKTIKRTNAFIGTANPGKVIVGPDYALSKRFAFINCTKGHNVELYMEQWREHFWALAYQEYKDNFEFRLVPKEYVKEQDEMGDEHRVIYHEIIEKIDDALTKEATLIRLKNPKGLKLIELCRELNIIHFDEKVPLGEKRRAIIEYISKKYGIDTKTDERGMIKKRSNSPLYFTPKELECNGPEYAKQI